MISAMKREKNKWADTTGAKKDTVEDSTKLSISKLKEFGLLEGCCSTRAYLDTLAIGSQKQHRDSCGRAG